MVNLSTTKKRSSVTTLLTSSSSKLDGKRYFSYNLGSQSSPISQYSLESDANIATGFSNSSSSKRNLEHNLMESNCASNSNLASSAYVAGPQSAPPSLSKPFYSTSTTKTTAASSKTAILGGGPGKDTEPERVSDKTTIIHEIETNQRLPPPPPSLPSSPSLSSSSQVINVREITKGDRKEGGKEYNIVKSAATTTTTSKSSRQNSIEENSPEPIVEIKPSSSSADTSEPASSDCESSSSTRLVRRRTVRRYQQRATEEKEEEEEQEEKEGKSSNKRSTAQLTISISPGKKEIDTNDREEGFKSHFRTRQIGAYLGAKQHQQQVSTSSSSSKIAKCSITTNRKSTTISESLSSSTQKAASELKNATTEVKSAISSKQTMNSEHSTAANVEGLYSRTSAAVAATGVQPTFELDRLNQKNVLSESSRSIKVREQEESSVKHQRQSFSTRSILGGSGTTTISREAASSSCSRASEAAAKLVSASSSRLLSSHQNGSAKTSSSSSSSSSSTMSDLSNRQFKTSASLIVSGNQQESIASSSSLASANHSLARTTFHDESEEFSLASESLFSSPQVRSLAKETWRDFAELENHVLSSTVSFPTTKGLSTLSTRLFGRRLLSPISDGPQYPAISNSSSGQNLFEDPSLSRNNNNNNSNNQDNSTDVSSKIEQNSDFSNNRINGNYDRATEFGYTTDMARSNTTERSPSGDKIKELLNKAELHAKAASRPTTLVHHRYALKKDDNEDSSSHLSLSNSGKNNSDNNLIAREISGVKSEGEKELHKKQCKTGMSVSIGKIDQRMSDVCKELNECHDTKKAIDLLKMMIQMIEKAWSVPICGDDLGFRLCNSLREAGGLDIVLGFVQESENQGLLCQQNNLELAAEVEAAVAAVASTPPSNYFRFNKQRENQKSHLDLTSSVQAKNNNSPNQLKLNLSKITQSVEQSQNNMPSSGDETATKQTGGGGVKQDSDSDILTSDLGLDSASVESLSYVSANTSTDTAAQTANSQQLPNSSDLDGKLMIKQDAINKEQIEFDNKQIKTNDASSDNEELELENEIIIDKTNDQKIGGENLDDDQEANLRKEELVFLSARLLSQCLTSENRDYIVNNCLDPVIKLACNFTMMKSVQSKRLMSRSKIIRQSSTVVSNRTSPSASKIALNQPLPLPQVVAGGSIKEQSLSGSDYNQDSKQQQQQQQTPMKRNFADKDQMNQDDTQQQNKQTTDSDTHAIIGTEILQHLFKHSENTCSKIISLGGLQAILYGCRSSNTETLRHCASALVNLALYGGSDSQEIMIEQKAQVWLFPLAFNEDDNVQYYACLAIVVLVANQEIEADVLKSSTLDLVEPFVTSHEPRKFAESTTSHIHGQSASWLCKLIPLLESKREEARNLACFHFAMEAYIKREQGQTEVFKNIGAVEPLKKVGSSPRAIASKFACQALRLIGEKEPHRLSQQVPLWTSEDVIEWVGQIGFQNYKQAFMDSRVDGDLLLQIDEDMLRTDIGIQNGIIRKRFLRELNHLKKIADYSSVDKSGLCSLLLNNPSSNTPTSSPPTNITNGDFVQYIYTMVQLGVTRDNIHLLDCEQLLRECKVTNTIHRMKLALAIKELQEKSAILAASNETNSQDGADLKTLDVFVSYRRSTGSQLASLLKVHLQLRGFSVFIDVERLEAGKFDNNLLDSIKTAKNFILVLSPNALDRCIGDHECKDWVHKEIVAALTSNCNIIPIMDNFHWPDAEQLPEDMRSITYFNGVRWIHDYQDACVDKIERFIRGEIYDGSMMAGAQSTSSITSGCLQRGAGFMNYSATTPSIIATPSVSAANASAFQSNCSTSGYSSSSRAPSSFEILNTTNDYHPLSFASHN